MDIVALDDFIWYEFHPKKSIGESVFLRATTGVKYQGHLVEEVGPPRKRLWVFRDAIAEKTIRPLFSHRLT